MTFVSCANNVSETSATNVTAQNRRLFFAIYFSSQGSLLHAYVPY